MISAQQVKQMLEIITSNSQNQDGSKPALSFSASPNSYSVTDIPGSIAFTGTIIPGPNTFEITGWAIKYNNSAIASGTGTSVSYTMPGGSVPDTIGTYAYFLEVTYLTEEGGTPQTLATSLNISVLEAGYIGYMNSPTGDISAPGDVSNAVLTDITKQAVINYFEITNIGTSRLVIILPTAFGTLVSISDNTDQIVTTEFNIVADPSNNRTIYVSKNPLAENTYRYKINY